ncbi:ribonuclease H1-like [Phlebotomus argentipes]|uniref:ribonuclease H1-like n=1 Tax=Phlebotomus argentipes TaxID=94469 RepID=UPI0028937ED7|nr:ribonuclease H1-like [Phlebotomus argentipes]
MVNKMSRSWRNGAEDWVDVWLDSFGQDDGTSPNSSGFGVFWEDGHPWNVSENGQGMSKIRCDIAAAIVAIQIAKNNMINTLRLNTSSDFLINFVLDWMPIWRNNNWRAADGERVANWTQLKMLSDEFDGTIRIFCNLVSADNPVYGMEMAYNLARRAALN